MRSKEYESLGVTVPFQVPETIEEYERLAKRQGACLDEAIDNVVYRGCLASFRKAFVAAFEKATGVARKTRSITTTSDGKETVRNVPDESEGRYIDRALEELHPGDELAILKYQPLVADVLKLTDKSGRLLCVFDPSEAERKERKESVAKQYLDAVPLLIAALSRKGKTLAQWMQHHNVVVPNGADELTAVAIKLRDIEKKSAEQIAEKNAKI